MPAVKVSDEDLDAVAGAALEAASIGDMNEARSLDKLARKIRRALSRDQQAASVPEQLPVTAIQRETGVPILQPAPAAARSSGLSVATHLRKLHTR